MKLRVSVGLIFVVASLALLRFFQLSDASLLWICLMGLGVVMFVIGSRWVLEGVNLFADYRGMWPVFSAAMAIAWLIHAAQVESYAANSLLGRFFGTVTVYATLTLLHISQVPVAATGDVLSFGPPSLIGAVEVTPLCGGFLSVLMFIAAFSFVTVDVGRSLGLRRLMLLLLGGIAVTVLAAVLRVYVVTLVGFHYGWSALNLAHVYLGYVLFLSVMSLFWYISLRWSKRLTTRGSTSPRRPPSRVIHTTCVPRT
ncbi:MAG: archaeosortase/exosortase family protein [Candidatus Bathyarchaeia archaeon]